MPNLSLFRRDPTAERLAGVRDGLAGRTVMEKLLPLGQIQDLYRRARPEGSESLLENVLSEMRIERSLDEQEMSRIPATGPVLVVSNHPSGILDGAVLGAVMSRVRPDVKIVTNVLLREIEELQEHCIFANPFGSKEAVASNGTALLQCALAASRGHVSDVSRRRSFAPAIAPSEGGRPQMEPRRSAFGSHDGCCDSPRVFPREEQ